MLLAERPRIDTNGNLKVLVFGDEGGSLRTILRDDASNEGTDRTVDEGLTGEPRKVRESVKKHDAAVKPSRSTI